LLLTLAAAAWVTLLWQSRMAGGAMGLTMGLSASLFLVVWIIMMIAMMFPAAVPMVQMLQRIGASRQLQGQASVPAWVFVAGYLVVWAAFGALAYFAATGVDRAANQSMWLMVNGARLGGLVLLVAGVYQLTPLKRVCLSKCRSPISFLLTSWHDGYGGGFRMGLEHGGFCLGCCWAMMAVLFVVGVMSLPWMALLAAAIFVEKNLRFERVTTAAHATLFVVVGLALIVYPGILPRISF
jgi:predicted metal-binding membrane protein